MADKTPSMFSSSKENLLKQMQAVFDASLCTTIIATDLDGTITFFNKGAEKILGYRAKEVVGKVTPAILHDKDEVVQRARELTEELEYPVEGFETFVAYAKKGLYEEREWTYIRKDGSRITVVLSVTPIYNDLHEIIGFLGTAVDISERKAVQERLSASEELFRRLFHDSGDALLLIIDGKFVDCNQNTVKMLGAESKDQVLHTHPSELSPQYQDDGRLSSEKAEEMMDIAFKYGSHRFEWTHQKMNGEAFPVEVVLTAITMDDKKVLHTCWRDISDRRLAEEKLRQSQKMEVIGQLAGGVAHDFNNILSGILGASDLLLDELSHDDPLYELVDLIHTSALRGSDLTKKLLSFARKGQQDTTNVDVHESVNSVLHLLEHTIDRSILLSSSLEASHSTIRGDRNQLENALINLAVNARDAIVENGTITITTANIAISTPKQFITGFELPAGEYLRLTISDNGPGITKEIQRQIFEPFFTTKEAGKGTGLGLASVYGMMKEHDGAIDLISTVQKGTAFHLYFPVLTEEQMPTQPIHMGFTQPELSATILVVDDEDLVRNIFRRMLQTFGYKVITARDGGECLDIYEEQGDTIDLVILDMIMPVMSGSDCFRKLREIDPSAKVIIASGYTRDENMEILRNEGVLGFVEKPVQKDALNQAIIAALLQN